MCHVQIWDKAPPPEGLAPPTPSPRLVYNTRSPGISPRAAVGHDTVTFLWLLDKWQQAECLKEHRCYCLTLLEARSLRSVSLGQVRALAGLALRGLGVVAAPRPLQLCRRPVPGSGPSSTLRRQLFPPRPWPRPSHPPCPLTFPPSRGSVTSPGPPTRSRVTSPQNPSLSRARRVLCAGVRGLRSWGSRSWGSWGLWSAPTARSGV